MSFGIIRAYRSIDNIFSLFQILATAPDGWLADYSLASAVALSATSGAFCFTVPQDCMGGGRP